MKTLVTEFATDERALRQHSSSRRARLMLPWATGLSTAARQLRHLADAVWEYMQSRRSDG